MSELKAMGLVGVGMFAIFAVLVAAILMLRAPGELVAVAMVIVAMFGALAMVRVIEHYETVNERRKREEILLR
jgi:nitrate/nitrite transporter NarK